MKSDNNRLRLLLLHQLHQLLPFGSVNDKFVSTARRKEANHYTIGLWALSSGRFDDSVGYTNTITVYQRIAIH